MSKNRKILRRLRNKSARKAVAAIATVATSAALLAACGSGTAGSSSKSTTAPSSKSTTTSAPTEYSLTVADPIAEVDFAPLYLATDLGYFKKNHLNVTILSGPVADTVQYLVSGKAQLDLFTGAAALETAQKGENISVIYAASGIYGLALMGSSSVKTVAQAQALTNCRFATDPPGSLAYAEALSYITKLHLKCQPVVVSTISDLVAGLKSGSYQLADGTVYSALQAQNGGASIVIDPRKAGFNQKYGPTTEYPLTMFFGIATTLQAKKPAVVDFIRAINEAEKAIHDQSTTKLAGVLAKDSNFAGQTLQAIKTTITYEKPFFYKEFGGKPGEVTKSAWNAMITAFKGWDLPNYSVTSPANAYSKRVDLSYFNAAATS